MTMSMKRSDIAILIGFAGIAIAFCCYWFGFKEYTERTATLEAENAYYGQQIVSLQDIYNNKGQYASDTEKFNAEVAAIYSLFPVDVKEEDSILLAIYQELLSPMDIDSIAIDMPVAVDFTDKLGSKEPAVYYDPGYDVMGDGSTETYGEATGTEGDMPANTQEARGILMNRRATFNYNVAYDGLKRSITHIASQLNRTGIEAIALAYNEETGLLSGSTTVNMFSIPMQDDKEYEQPDFTSVLLGNENIFGTIEITVNDAPSEGENPAE